MKIKRLRTSVRWFIVVSLWMFAVLPAGAEESTTPFIVGIYWKKNIPLQLFQSNPRIYYRSEGAFQLSRQYAERVTGQSLTDAEFVALLRSERARTIDCEGEITTGALQGDEFYWFTRQCRVDEEKIQLRVADRWVDFMSLGCLNAVEDKTPALVPLPPVTPVVVAESAPIPEKEKSCRFVPTASTKSPDIYLGGSFIGSGFCITGTPGLMIQGQVAESSELVCEEAESTGK